MKTHSELRNQMLAQAQGALALHIAFIGAANNLFSTFAEKGSLTAEELAVKTGLDNGYVERWCDAAFAFDFLNEEQGRLTLTDLGRAFVPEAPGTLMPLAVHSILSAHVAERVATFMKTGERPGEKVLAECESVLPLFGSMMEAMFSEQFEQHILPHLAIFKSNDEKSGTVVDLGCGNGWYLRKIATHFPHMTGIGVDGMKENIHQAQKRAQEADLDHRLTFMVGDIHRFPVQGQVDMIAMNRSLHHVWGEREEIFHLFAEHLKDGGAVVIWEPNWPKNRRELHNPAKRVMAFHNLNEHVQGNHFLNPEQIEAEFHRIGMKTQTCFFANENEVIIIGQKEGAIKQEKQ
jgi:SAM-dependent methyltransferase